jgi:hypothetical protein
MKCIMHTQCKLQAHLNKKTQTTYEHALTNTCIYGGIEPLKLAIPT